MAKSKFTLEAILEEKYGHQAKRIVQVEMKKRGLGYRELTEKLNEGTPVENERNVRNKIARATFSAGFMIKCMRAMGCTSIDLSYVFDENFAEPK